jgi:hypothetical protein
VVHRPLNGELVELRRWTLARGVSAWLGDLHPYEACRVAGVIDQLSIDPRAGIVEVCMSDGTGAVTAQWVIRRPTPQLALAPGTGVVLSGVASVGIDGRLILREPAFETAPFSEVV